MRKCEMKEKCVKVSQIVNEPTSTYINTYIRACGRAWGHRLL